MLTTDLSKIECKIRSRFMFGLNCLSLGILFLMLCFPSLSRAQNIREEIKKEEAKLTKAPKLLKFVDAKYPQEAIDKKIAGNVSLSITIKADGKVANVKVLAAPLESLGQAAAIAAKQFVFSPAEVNHKPAAVVIRYQYHFLLRADFKPREPAWLKGDYSLPSDVIVGRVREQGNRLPLAGVAIAVMEAGIEVKSDDKGRFRIKDLPPGTYTVRAISLEHQAQALKVVVSEGVQSRIKFYLKSLNNSDYETVVRGKRRQTSITRVALRGRQLTTVPGTFGDPVRVIENLPGVARVPFVGGALLIRGAAPNDSGSFLDGVRIPILFHFLGGPSVLNPVFIDRIDYYPGNADARYGRLTAGVIDVATADTYTKQWHGTIDLNLLNVGVSLQAPITDKISVSAAFRRSYIDAILPSVLEAAGAEATSVVPIYYDYQLRVDTKLRGDDRLSVLFFGSDDDLTIASSESDSDFSIDLSTRTLFHRLVVEWKSYFAKGKGESRFKPWIGYNLVSASIGDANFEIHSRMAGLREDFELKIKKSFKLRFGADAEINVANFDAEIPIPKPYRNPAVPGAQGDFENAATSETESIDITQTIGSVGLYVDAVFNFTEKLQIIPGLRFDLFIYQEDNVRPNLDPRLTLRYQLLSDTVLKAASGMYSRAPGPGQTNIITGNPNLLVEQAAHFAVGIEHRFSQVINVDAQLYYLRRFQQAVLTDLNKIVDNELTPLRYRSDGVGYSTGLELILKHEVTKHFYGWVAYTLSLSKQQIESGGKIVRFPFDQRHILTAVGSFRFGSGWEFGARFRLVTGRPETPVLQGAFDADKGTYQPVEGEEFSVSRQTFHQLDLRLEKTWIFDLWRFSLYLDIQNVYNAENPEATLYDYRFRESGPLQGLPFLPTLGIKGSF